MIQHLFHFVFPMPPLASLEGRDIDTLMYLIHGLILVLFIGWAIFFVVVLFKFRKSVHPKVQLTTTQGTVASNVSSVVEWSVAALEFILLFAFSIPFWSGHITRLPDSKDAVHVDVVAQQFAWNVHYPGPDGIFGKTSARYLQDNPLGLDPDDPHGKDDITAMNEINVPVGKPVIINLTSKDVIHSLGIPAMRVKQDAIPGMQVSLGFTPIKIGQYEIACSQLCGLGHYRMRGILNVESQQDYDDWIQQEKGTNQ